MDGRARVAWQLRRLRVAQGLTQEALAVDADVDRSYVSGIERRTFNPTIDILDRLAVALSVDVGTFLIRPSPGDARPAPLPPGRRKS